MKKALLTDNKYLWLLAVVSLSLLSVFPAIFNGWVSWDDPSYILNNPLIRDLSPQGITQIFSTLEVNGTYSPLTLCSWAIDYAIWELNPMGFHLSNVILHLLIVSGVFMFVYQLQGNLFVATMVALLFGIHPMHLEVVAWVSARKDLVYSFFYLLSLLLYLHHVSQKKALSAYLFLALMAFIFSLLGKGMAVSLPLVLILIDYYLKRENWPRLLLEKVPFFALSLAFGLLAIAAQQESEALTELVEISYTESFFIGFYGLGVYLLKAIVPFQLSGMHPYPFLPGEAIPWYIYAPLLPLVLAGIWVLIKGRKSRELLFGLGFFLATIGLVLQFIPVGFTIMAERFSYVPYLGLFFMMATGVHRLHIWLNEKKPQWTKAMFAGLAIYLLILGGITFQRCKVWKGNFSFWQDVAEKYPNDFLVYANLSDAYVKTGNWEEALTQINKSIALNPRNSLIYNNRGMVYLSLTQRELALKDFEKAIALDRNAFEAYTNRGLIFMNQGQAEKAMADFDKSLQLNPKQASAYYNRGILQGQSAQYSQAISDLDKAIDLRPDNALFHKDRAMLLYLNGAAEASLPDFNRAIELNPNFDLAYYLRSEAFRKLGQFELARGDALKAQELGFRLPEGYWESLGAGN